MKNHNINQQRLYIVATAILMSVVLLLGPSASQISFADIITPQADKVKKSKAQPTKIGTGGEQKTVQNTGAVKQLTKANIHPTKELFGCKQGIIAFYDKAGVLQTGCLAGLPVKYTEADFIISDSCSFLMNTILAKEGLNYRIDAKSTSKSTSSSGGGSGGGSKTIINNNNENRNDNDNRINVTLPPYPNPTTPSNDNGTDPTTTDPTDDNSTVPDGPPIIPDPSNPPITEDNGTEPVVVDDIPTDTTGDGASDSSGTGINGTDPEIPTDGEVRTGDFIDTNNNGIDDRDEEPLTTTDPWIDANGDGIADSEQDPTDPAYYDPATGLGTTYGTDDDIVAPTTPEPEEGVLYCDNGDGVGICEDPDTVASLPETDPNVFISEEPIAEVVEEEPTTETEPEVVEEESSNSEDEGSDSEEDSGSNNEEDESGDSEDSN